MSSPRAPAGETSGSGDRVRQLTHDLANPLTAVGAGVDFALQELETFLAGRAAGDGTLRPVREAAQALSDARSALQRMRARLREQGPSAAGVGTPPPVHSEPRSGPRPSRILIIDDQAPVATAVQR